MNNTPAVNKQRMVKTFIELVKIDSLSGKEGKIARHLTGLLKGLGAEVIFDNAGKATGGEVGNLIAKFKGTKEGKPFLISAHMDTVGPGEGIKPVIGKKRICSSGDTILGADCKAGITVILEVIRILKEHKLPHPPIEVLLTVSEEIGILGAKYLDYSKLKSKSGIVLDSESPYEVTIKAPAAHKMEIQIHGYAAHAGMCPEKGLSAIEIASKAIAKMKLGRIDYETTANIGVINGGSATNIVTPLVILKGEARSHTPKKLETQTKHMLDIFKKTVDGARVALNGKKIAAKLDVKVHKDYPHLSIPESDPVLKALLTAGKNMGIKIKTVASGGGSDANIFFSHGICAINIGNGMWEPHTTREYLDIDQFFTSAELTLETVKNL